MGDCPAWYPVITAATRLHCPPWDLMDPDDDAPHWAWIELANAALAAEAHSNQMHRQRGR